MDRSIDLSIYLSISLIPSQYDFPCMVTCKGPGKPPNPTSSVYI